MSIFHFYLFQSFGSHIAAIAGPLLGKEK